MFSSVGKVASMNNRLVIEYEEGRESMEPVCEFCGAARAVVYCKSDSARLCLQCDGYVHSANSLSRRHLRSLLCDKCNSQPAMIRCLDEKLSICQGCDWSPNGCSGLGHRLKVLTCYTGCPTIAEFSRIWSWVLEPPSSSSCDAGWRALSGLPFSENCVSNCLEQRNNEESFGMVNTKLNELEPCPKLEPWIMPTAMIPPNLNCTAYCRDQAPCLPEESNKPKAFSNCKCPGIQDDEYLCEGLNIDNVQLSLESGDEIFGCSQVQTKNQLEDVGNDCILMERNLSVTESNGPIENALEASSSGHHDSVAFQSSCVAVSANVMQAARHSANCFHMNPSCDRNINLGFPTGTGQVHSSLSLSLSNMTGESSAANYQDCGLSPVFLTCESPWESSLEASCPQARDKAKMRYNEKKKTRTFGKQIRYASCKARADTRKRVKGRFVKAGEAYD